MHLDQFKEVLDIISQKNCNEDNIIEEIKQELQEKCPDFYQEWERSNFNVDYRIRIHHDNNIVENTTLSHLATDGGYTNIVRPLIEKGASVSVVKTFKYYEVYGEAGILEVDGMGEIVLGSRPIKMVNGYSLLHSAIKHDNENLVRFLIDRGADVNVKTIDGWTPLHCAAAGVNGNIVSLLIQNNANINDRVLSKRHLTGTEDFLIQNNANIYDKIPECRSLFKDYSFTPLHFAALNGNCNIARILTENGANPLLYERVGVYNTPEADFTPLDLAAANNHYDMVKMFTENGMNPLFVNNKGKISRAYAKDEKIIELLAKAENKYLRDQTIKFGVICGGIAAMAIMIGCIAVNIELATAIISVTAAFVIGTGIVGGITYFMNKPSSELNEVNPISVTQPAKGHPS